MMLDDWVNAQTTPRGIGIDCVCVSQLRALDERLGGTFVQRTFTDGERALAESAADRWQFLAGRFAVKEAVFKALSCQGPTPFDFRKVETLRREDGCPVITAASVPEAAGKGLGAARFLVSITGEGDYVIALVQLI